jgi:hypothetical protein
MTAALPALRLPFWDAAAVPPVGTGSYPCKCAPFLQNLCGFWLTAAGSVQRKTIEVELPDGTGSVKTTILNPLYAYTFHPLPGKDIFVSNVTQEAFRTLKSVGKTPMDTLADNNTLPHGSKRQCAKSGF